MPKRGHKPDTVYALVRAFFISEQNSPKYMPTNTEAGFAPISMLYLLRKKRFKPRIRRLALVKRIGMSLNKKKPKSPTTQISNKDKMTLSWGKKTPFFP